MRSVALAAAVLAIALAAGCGGDSKSGPKTLDLKIGNLLPLTGGLEAFGKPSERSADVAVEEIRKAVAKVGANHKVTISNVDYKSEPATAVDLANGFVKKGVSCITGPFGSGHAVRVAAFATVTNKVLQISPSASAKQVSEVQDRGYLNRVVPPDTLQTVALAEYMSKELGGARGKTVNIGALESTYGETLTKSFEDAWRSKGGSVGRKVTYRFDATSVAGQGDQLAQGKPDAWVFFDFMETYIRLGQELLADKRAHWSPSKTFGTDSLANPRLPNVGPTVSNGLSGVAISAPQKGKAAEAFDAAFKRAGGTNRQTFDAQEFDSVVLCYLAAVAAGSTKGAEMKDELRAITAAPGKKYTWLQLDQAIRALEAGEDIDYEGVSGPIELDRKGDATAGVYDIYRYTNGELKVVDQIAVPIRGGGV
jgi:ABC-type branched-subunit amino acid transport system substrate-binding protein